MVAFVVVSPSSFLSAASPRTAAIGRRCGARTGVVTLSMSGQRSVVWIREGDYRTVDHPGLLAAADAEAAAAVIMPDANGSNNNITKNSVVMALESALRKRLGIPLSLVADEDGGVASLAKFVSDFQATCVHVRLDESEESRRVVNELVNALPSHVAVNTWQDEYRTWGGSGSDDDDDDTTTQQLDGIPYEYPSFKRWRNRKNLAIQPISDTAPCAYLSEDSGASLTFPPAQAADGGRKLYSQFVERYYDADSALANTVMVDPSEATDVDEYGERILQRYLETCDANKNPDMLRSLAPIFSYGLLSSRRIRELVAQYERDNGRLWRFIYRDGAKQVLDYLDAREFAQLLARRDLATEGTVDGVHRARFWRWKGYLIRYVMEGPGDANLPTLLCVHGFGASVQHWRRSMALLKDNNEMNILALDLVGYGRSEKPPAAYTPELWGMILFDFVKEVVGRPVYIAGNSIGGYFAAAFARDAYPNLCAGLILVNSAGKLEDPPSIESASASTTKDTRKSFSPLAPIFSGGKVVLENYPAARMLAANILLNNLRGRIQKTLQMVYPTNPECADVALAEEIYRNSLDYGADYVLASGLVLPPPRSLSELLKAYDGKVLVYQGVLDPLNSASSDRAEKIRREYPEGTWVEKRDLGHCPHEEDGGDFSKTVANWIMEREKESNNNQIAQDPTNSSTEVAIWV